MRQPECAQIECSRCGNQVPIDYADLDVQQVDADERDMGPELIYYGSVDIACPRCRHSFKVEYTATEYPLGVPNYDETSADGGRVVTGFGQLDVAWGEQIYEFDDDARLYVPQQQAIVTELGYGAAELISAAYRNPDVLFDAAPRAFEEMVAYIFEKHGFQVELTKQTRDGGRDLVALRTDELGVPVKYLIECKRYARDRSVGVEIVRSLFGVQQAEGANKALIVTTSSFSADARAFSQRQNTTAMLMTLVDFHELRRWIANTAKRK